MPLGIAVIDGIELAPEADVEHPAVCMKDTSTKGARATTTLAACLQARLLI